MACAICEVRRPRRYCPGVRDDICTICCGTEREVTVSCPLDCEYLQDARKHEKPPEIDPEQVPNRDIKVTEDFLRDNERLLMVTGQTIYRAAVETPGVIDNDIREALVALIRTYQTRESGLYYETRPNNPLAGAVCVLTQNAVAEHRRQETETMGVSKTRDADVLGVLVFLQRLEYDRNNGRPRGRAFVDFLGNVFPSPESEAAAGGGSPLVLP